MCPAADWRIPLKLPMNSKMSTSATYWKEFFREWPAGLARKGVLVTSFGEQIPFSGFLTGDMFLAIERVTPDTLGARMLVFPYEAINALKITDVVKTETFTKLGFAGAPKKAS